MFTRWTHSGPFSSNSSYDITISRNSANTINSNNQYSIQNVQANRFGELHFWQSDQNRLPVVENLDPPKLSVSPVGTGALERPVPGP